jgi:hypothetical protein
VQAQTNTQRMKITLPFHFGKEFARCSQSAGTPLRFLKLDLVNRGDVRSAFALVDGNARGNELEAARLWTGIMNTAWCADRYAHASIVFTNA